MKENTATGVEVTGGQHEITVEDLDEPTRLDLYLAAYLSPGDFSRTRIQKLIADAMVLVDGKHVKPAWKLEGGERLSVTIPPGITLELKAQPIPLNVVYEDEHLIVVNKPPGMVTHPGAGVPDGTLVNALLHHCGDSLSGISGVLRPGIVHRLDKDTSGLIVAAKSDPSHRGLSDEIGNRRAVRRYLAVLEGNPPEIEGTVTLPIGRHPRRRKQMAVVEGGRHAVTHYTVLKSSNKFSLIEARLQTGRTHQIRVHMASLGTPVVADLVYNRKSTGTEKMRHKLQLKGQALHAAYLSFTHPITGRLLEFHAPPPPELQKLIDSF